jgi:hypothetical protein
MSFSGFFSSLGGKFGQSLGGGILSTIGRFAGKMLGQYLDELMHDPDETFNYKKQLKLLFLNSDIIGKPIPLVFGKMKVFGQIIWTKPITETENISTNTQYFELSGREKNIHHTVSYKYYTNFAVAICEGEIEGIEKVWVNDKLISLADYNYTLYVGSNTQNPDPLIQQDQGPKTCAFRGLAYIVFKDLPLEDFGNKIPNFAFEVVRKVKLPNVKAVEDLIKSIIIIPGSGEFVYDTELQYKIYSTEDNVVLETEVINSHNHKGIANSVYSLEQLLAVCPNLESVGVVVCWFGTSLHLRECSILPAVEYKDEHTTTSEPWRVANFTRNTAKLIGFEGMHPRYGGTVNDASLVRYLQELKRHNLKVTLYPMFFMDLPGKPWRGHLSGHPADVEHFFNKIDGYNNFILHYANLTKNLADVFIIGSELKKITSIKSQDNNFPAVDELVKLAEKARNIVGGGTKITYAADWSEYHHTDGGWFHLDKLWASQYIDFVGIDAYVPITFSANSQISDEQILQGWSSGEGFDYYIDENGQKIPLPPQYAWKNFYYWWNNAHINPDNNQTEWQPRMKKICFTEFGYPSIDKATNQPNVFFDPNCVDGGAPIYSNQTTDFSIQRRAIKLALQYWQNNEMLQDMYLWTWDARPYPAWPYYSIWTDGYLWEKGHWVNNKLGLVSLAGIITVICLNAGIEASQIDVRSLDTPVEGLVFDKFLSAMDAINLLRCCYFFDIYQDQGCLVFRARGSTQILNIDERDLVKLDSSKNFILYENSGDQILSQVNISFINQNKKYETETSYLNLDINSNARIHFLRLPIVMSEIDADRISSVIIHNSRIESRTLKFALPITYLHLHPGDIVSLTLLNTRYLIRIVDIELQSLILRVTAVPEDTRIYSLAPAANSTRLLELENQQEKCLFLELPKLPWLPSQHCYIHIVYSNIAREDLRASVDNQNFDKILELSNQGKIGTLISFENHPEAGIYSIDNKSKFIIYSNQPIVSISEQEFFQKTNFAVVGNEVFRFQKVEVISANTYQLSKLIRGEIGTEMYINTHNPGEKFAIIGQNLSSIKIDNSLVSRELYFKINNKKHSFKITDYYTIPSPVKLKYSFNDTRLSVVWTGRSLVYDDWIRAFEDKTVEYEVKITSDNDELTIRTHEHKVSIDLMARFRRPIIISVKSLLKDKTSLPISLTID